MRVFKDLEYDNQSELQKLDLYLPSINKGPYPLVVFIHGGAWQFGDKAEGAEKDWLNLVNNGYALASINYRLNDEVKHPEGLIDCRKALNFLAKNADKYNIDTERIGVAGTSAGGYYALMLATTNDLPIYKIEGEDNADIKCCVALYSPTDFNEGKKLAYGSLLNRIKYGISIAITEKYFGKALKDMSGKELMEASPVNYISKTLLPILLQQGDNDFIIPSQQADNFLEKAEEIGVDDKVIVEILNGAQHVDPMFSTIDNQNRIRRFFDQNLKK